MTRPTELTLTIAALPRDELGERSGWVYADEVRHRLGLLGFDASTQQVAMWLHKMSRADSPWIETRKGPWASDVTEYRVTRYGRTDVDNRLPGVRLHTPWLPTMRATA